MITYISFRCLGSWKTNNLVAFYGQVRSWNFWESLQKFWEQRDKVVRMWRISGLADVRMETDCVRNNHYSVTFHVGIFWKYLLCVIQFLTEAWNFRFSYWQAVSANLSGKIDKYPFISEHWVPQLLLNIAEEDFICWLNCTIVYQGLILLHKLNGHRLTLRNYCKKFLLVLAFMVKTFEMKKWRLQKIILT